MFVQPESSIWHFKLTTMSDPLLMNAFNNINLAAACIITSTDFARELGVPEEKWIYPLGGAGTQDSSDCKRLAPFEKPALY